MHYKLFFVKALSKRLRKLTIITKQLIAIIIVSFDNNKRVDNKNDYNKQVFIANFAISEF